MPKRRWTTWPKRFGNALTETSGIISIAGVGISAVGATVAAPALFIFGGITISLAVLYAGYRGIPPKLKSGSELVGLTIPIEELDEIDHPILKLGIVGSTQSGKTTFLQQALQRPAGTTRTNKVYASVVALQTTPTKYIALIDGDGDQFAQQFQVAEHADFLLIYLDHNLGDISVAKSKERIEEHDRFMKQLESHIKKRHITRIHVVLNKRDLWEKSKNAVELKAWFEAHVDHLKQVSNTDGITSDIHSNLNATDIGKVLSLISDRAVVL